MKDLVSNTSSTVRIPKKWWMSYVCYWPMMDVILSNWSCMIKPIMDTFSSSEVAPSCKTVWAGRFGCASRIFAAECPRDWRSSYGVLAKPLGQCKGMVWRMERWSSRRSADFFSFWNFEAGPLLHQCAWFCARPGVENQSEGCGGFGSELQSGWNLLDGLGGQEYKNLMAVCFTYVWFWPLAGLPVSLQGILCLSEGLHGWSLPWPAGLRVSKLMSRRLYVVVNLYCKLMNSSHELEHTWTNLWNAPSRGATWIMQWIFAVLISKRTKMHFWIIKAFYIMVFCQSFCQQMRLDPQRPKIFASFWWQEGLGPPVVRHFRQTSS